MSFVIDVPSDVRENIVSSNHRKPIANNTCFHFTRRHALFDSWIAAYDGRHPIADIGCAQGQHVVDALMANKQIRVIACDSVECNIAEVKEAAKQSDCEDRVLTVVGSLPKNLPRDPFGPGSLSSILCSEVLHFMEPAEFEQSISEFKKMLAPGGQVQLSMASSTTAMVQVLELVPGLLERFGHWIEGKCFATTFPKVLQMDRLAADIVAHKGEYREEMQRDIELRDEEEEDDIENQMDMKMATELKAFMYNMGYVRFLLIDSGFEILSSSLSAFPDYPVHLTNGKDRMLIVARRLPDPETTA